MASRAQKTTIQKKTNKAAPRKTGRKRSSPKRVGRARKKTAKKNPRAGSSLESLLRGEGLYEDATAKAIKGVIAWQVETEMREQGISKAGMAEAMGTSRSALDRLLDPENESVTLSTLFRAASVLGVELRVDLVRPD